MSAYPQRRLRVAIMIYKILGLLFVMAVAEGTLFYFALNRTLVTENAGLGSTGLEQLFTRSWAALVCVVFFTVAIFLLILTGYEHGSKQGYTLRRLSVSERSVFLWQAVYNTFCCFLFWAVLLGIALALCKLYVAKVGLEYVSGQTIFLAFYRNNFLHSLLPLEETSRYIRNVVLILGLGISSACFPFKQRRGTRKCAAPQNLLFGVLHL